MIAHYLTTAFLNMRAAPITTAARIVCLALGLLVMMTALGIVTDWRSADRELVSKDGRAVVITRTLFAGIVREERALETDATLGLLLREAAPELPAIARTRQLGTVAAAHGDVSIPLRGVNADPDLLKIFRFDFIEGRPETALQAADGVVLTQESARRLFGNAPALDRQLLLGGTRTVVVTGVIGPIPEPTHFSLDYLSAMPVDVDDPFLKTYALLPEGGRFGRGALRQVLDSLAPAMKPRMERFMEEPLLRFEYDVRDVVQITEYERARAMFGYSEARPVAQMLLALAALVLTVSCLSYANLAAAQALSRAKQTGMRRVLGAGRASILAQSWVEAALAVTAAFALAVAVLSAAAPVVEAQTGVDVLAAIKQTPHAIGALALVGLAVAALCALYPAFVLARVRPVEALRASRPAGRSNIAQQVFVGAQFALAGLLLVALTIMTLQNSYLRSQTNAGREDPVVVLSGAAESGVAFDVLRQELAGYPQIKGVTEGPARWGGPTAAGDLGLTDAPNLPYVALMGVGFEYFDFYGQRPIDGRTFTRGREGGRMRPGVPRDDLPDLHVVIDRDMQETLGFASPADAVGKQLVGGMAAKLGPFEIIGVVENLPHRVRLAEGDLGSVYHHHTDFPFGLPPPVLVRLAADDVGGGLAALRLVWERLAPDTPFEPQFEDQIFEEEFQLFERISRLFTILTAMALLSSAIGLVGMAVQSIQRRLHEVAVRKTLGSGKARVVLMLLADFSRPVIVANLIAWPLGYLAAQTYLSAFAHRIELSIWPFAASMLITLAIAWLAVGGQTFKAASVRPAQVLRDA